MTVRHRKITPALESRINYVAFTKKQNFIQKLPTEGFILLLRLSHIGPQCGNAAVDGDIVSDGLGADKALNSFSMR